MVALAIALVGGGIAYVAFTGGDDTQAGASGATGMTGEPTTGPTGATSSPNTVKPQPGPAEVACGGTEPKDASKPKPQFSAPEQVVQEGTTYTAEIQTSCGTIVIELLADRAPETVNSFVFLAQKGYFDGQRFHRLDTSIDVIQGGDPTGTGTGGPGYTIPDELTGDESYGPGVLAMANAGPDTGGSQFFLITGDAGAQPRREPRVHDLRDGGRGARRRQADPGSCRSKTPPPASRASSRSSPSTSRRSRSARAGRG